jgi:hypothetical protein
VEVAFLLVELLDGDICECLGWSNVYSCYSASLRHPVWDTGHNLHTDSLPKVPFHSNDYGLNSPSYYYRVF